MPSINGGTSIQSDLNDDTHSQYSVNSNPFYPRQKQRQMEEQKKQQQIVDSWAFQNDATRQLFEQRVKRAIGNKKKKNYTAAEKYEMLMAKKR